MLERTIPTLVTPEWLYRHIDEDDLRILDATWHLPGTRDGRENYEQEHIPGTTFFDIDDVCDPDTDLPHMLPNPALFAQKAGELGLCEDRRIVFYDSRGLYSAGRGWWMCNVFGLSKVGVLDGGLPAWKKAGLPVSHGTMSYPPSHCTPRFTRPLAVDLNQMKNNLCKEVFQYVDARSRGRFEGREDEPRPGLRRGHVPGSFNVPHTDLKVGGDGPLLPKDELRAAFAKAGVDLERPLVVGCGTGVTATVVALALEVLGIRDVPVYDGSWTEWASEPDLPSELG